MKESINRLFLPLVIVATYLFLYIPIIILIIFSFNDAPFPAPWHGFTLDWYYELFHTSEIWDAFITSFIVSSSATAISIAMAISLMYYQIYSPRTRRLLNLFYANLLIPEIFLAVGLISFLAYFSIPLGMPTLIVSHTLLGLGYTVPLIYARFLELDYRLTEASYDLGASPAETFFKITLPLLRPSIIASGLLVFIISFDDFLLSFFCAGSSAQTLSLYIFSMIRSGASPVVNALSTFLIALSSLLVALFCWLNNKTGIL